MIRQQSLNKQRRMFMKFYEVLRKYYTVSQLRIIPKMLKRIEIVGFEYIDICEEEFLSDRQCFCRIIDLIKRPCYCFYYPNDLKSLKDAPLPELVEKVFEIIEEIYKKSQKVEDVLQHSLSNKELYLFEKAVDIKYPHIIDELTNKYCFNPNDIISVVITYFDKEIREFYDGNNDDLTLKDIILFVNQAIMNGFYSKGYSVTVRKKMNELKKELIELEKES